MEDTVECVYVCVIYWRSEQKVKGTHPHTFRIGPVNQNDNGHAAETLR